MSATRSDEASGDDKGAHGDETARDGVRVAKILNAAEKAAEEIVASARTEAAALLADAEEKARGARRDADAAATRAIAEAQALGQEIVATAHAAARAIEDVALDRRARLRLQVRSLEERLEATLDDLRSLDAGLLDAVADASGDVPSAVDLEEMVEMAGDPPTTLVEELGGVVAKRGDRWIPTHAEGDDRDRDALLDRARELGIEGRLRMTTDELASAVGDASDA